ncbi:helix-turn-helix domain-containing protein [Lactobacillus helveticus]|uniref:helix-turn-helix domain-containing protein n=1 Tax=Lactobacillus helveticus TaxID=1587 RepID=UPI000D7C0ADD|nr:helix-turn-helix domain-containing protein [Lactobacillus helveticus]MBW8008608.1 AraC family transcriptional regulator [Lactobacillus helveticus]MBW8018216.1 AraC family transcriptional regulator [Lactobacillus helveticus]MBW8042888.1 AraC family transcriptional regulator [Lactobacillus helveticus]MBW8052121.1 AraC family transcriptional regulator [Lactobacillus helveticus]PXZ19575.1 hypothetical protein DM474_07320 [Lactobacillus helveticus]
MYLKLGYILRKYSTFIPSSYIHHNKEYLSNTDNTIQEISRIIGYNDEFTFSKAFKKYSGFSPKIYRQNLPK